MEQAKYDVFISYSLKDYVDEQKHVIPGNHVSSIKDALTEAGITYWFDEEGIYSGDIFTEKIVTNIEAAPIFVYLSTANANSSQWTSKEISCADEMKKYIIPVRIDRTPYNKKVLFRIADISYIDYYVNPERGLSELVNSIKSYLAQAQADEKQKEEEEEKERLRIAQEQERIISDIRLACAKLNNDEKKIELDRENLLLDTQKVADAKQQEELRALITGSGLSHTKEQIENPHPDELQSEMEDWADDEELIVYLTIEGTSYEEVEVRVSDPTKTIRDQIKSIVRVFELPEKEKDGTSIRYELGLVEDSQPPLILAREDEEGREQCVLDYGIQAGDHLHLIPVPDVSRNKYSWLQSAVVLIICVAFSVGMLYFSRGIHFDESGIQLTVALLMACVLALLYLGRLSTSATFTQWKIIRCLLALLFLINTSLLPIWEGSLTGPYFFLSIGLSIITSSTFLMNIKKE